MVVTAKLLVEVEMEIDDGDTESDEETVRYLVEQDLEDLGFVVNSCEVVNDNITAI